jgi:hypothetical protein
VFTVVAIPRAGVPLFPPTSLRRRISKLHPANAFVFLPSFAKLTNIDPSIKAIAVILKSPKKVNSAYE